MVVDTHYSKYVDPVRDTGRSLAYFLYSSVQKPLNYFVGTVHSVTYLASIREENDELRREVLKQYGKIHLLSSLEAENAELRAMLSLSKKKRNKAATASIISLNPDPFTKQVMIDLGTNNGIKNNCVVVDSKGVVGSVIDSKDNISRVMLLTDSNHSIPVESSRTGARGIVTGDYDKLLLKHMPNTSDILVGDTFVTSSIAGKYPYGYPVAKVTSVEVDQASPFAKIQLTPIAAIERNKFVLVLKTVG